jgi:hypothetical protein
MFKTIKKYLKNRKIKQKALIKFRNHTRYTATRERVGMLRKIKHCSGWNNNNG